MKVADITDFIGVTNTAAKKPIEPEKGTSVRENLGEKKVYLSWEAVPEMGSYNLDQRYKKTLLVIGAVILFLLVLMQEFVMIIFVASLFFIHRALMSAPKDPIKYEISTHGIKVGDAFYYWDELHQFFVVKRIGSKSVAVDVKEGLPKRIFLFYKEKDLKKIVEDMSKHLRYLEEEPLTGVDKAYLSIADKFEFSSEKQE